MILIFCENSLTGIAIKSQESANESQKTNHYFTPLDVSFLSYRNFNAPVLRLSFLRVVGGNGPVLSFRIGLDSAGIDPIFRQVVDDKLRPFPAESFIEIGVPRIIGMPRRKYFRSFFIIQVINKVGEVFTLLTIQVKPVRVGLEIEDHRISL